MQVGSTHKVASRLRAWLEAAHLGCTELAGALLHKGDPGLATDVFVLRVGLYRRDTDYEAKAPSALVP